MEDLAYDVLPDYADRRDFENANSLRSIAISMKRIADALDDGSSIALLDTLRAIEMNGRQN